MSRIHTSGPDQAYRQAVTAWQRERMGPIHPAGADTDKRWTLLRFVCHILAMAAVMAAVFIFQYI